MPIRWKLSLWYSGVFLGIITIFCSYLYLVFTHRETNQLDAYIKEKAIEVQQSIKVVDQFPLPVQKFVLPDIDVFSSSGIFLQVINQQGRVVSRSESLGGQSLPISDTAVQRIINNKDFYETKHVHNHPLRIYYLPLVAGNQWIGLLQVGASLHGLNQSLANLKLLLAIGALSAATLSAIIGWFLSRKSLEPIQRIIETTSAIQQEGALEQRIIDDGSRDEIGQLSLHINLMLEKIEFMYRELEESFETQRRFVADASHELRTPLTSIKGNMDFMKKLYTEKEMVSTEAMDDMIDEIERMTRIISNLLALARSDAGLPILMDEIPLRSWLEEWLDEIRGMATERVQFHYDSFDILEGVKIRGNRDFLKQILLVFFHNAFKFTHSGYVHLGFTLDADQVWFVIEDTGIGIPQQDMQQIFERFYRGENARAYPGTGLGLAIAKTLTEKHGGTIQFVSERNKGTKIELLLPTVS
jgi:two-component system OmpR family sensor kinase